MRRRMIFGLLLAGLVALSAAGVGSAAGRNSVRGDGTRVYGTFTASFSFDVVLKDGDVSGPFTYSNGQGHTWTGTASCGSVSGNMATFGGTATDENGAQTDVVFRVSNKPDGIIFGDGRPNCDTTGFGSPIPITTGTIKITGPHHD